MNTEFGCCSALSCRSRREAQTMAAQYLKEVVVTVHSVIVLWEPSLWNESRQCGRNKDNKKTQEEVYLTGHFSLSPLCRNSKWGHKSNLACNPTELSFSSPRTFLVVYHGTVHPVSHAHLPRLFPKQNLLNPSAGLLLPLPFSTCLLSACSTCVGGIRLWP